jgi:hypothetical protein
MMPLQRKANRKRRSLRRPTVELAKLHGDMDLETRSYMEYCQTVWRRLHELHEIVASSFDEVKVLRLPFPNKGVKVEEMIDWVVGEVKVVPDTIWQLNDNFAILGIEGVLNMLNGEGCQELNPVMLLSWKMFLRMCIGWWGRLCGGGGNHMACMRPFASLWQPTPRL